MRLLSSSIGPGVRATATLAMVLFAACGRTDKVVNYKVKLTNAPVCPANGDRAAGNNLKRVLMVKAETSSQAYTGFFFSGRNDGVEPHGGVAETNAQVMLAKSGKQSVKFRFGACPAKDKPAGNSIELGCEEAAVQWYAEQEVTFDPANMVIFGEAGESRTTVDWPWPSNELECWTGMATHYPTPL